MRTRMQPIGQVWSKMPRVVRDLALQLGREVELEMSGHETELDRSLLEALKGPLTHLVRNSLDHGIEPPAQRAVVGKPAAGRLTLRAFHESGQVIVEITDDGLGIDPARVGATAVARGVLTRETLARMDPRDVLDLVFQPGFSTAEQVTNVSGRGVGMDVVRSSIERIGGSVDLSSTVGVGTTTRIRIPLTLAIIPALLVGEGGERYAIPQANLVELVRLEGADLRESVETLAGAPVLRLRGRLLPLVSLDGLLGGRHHPRWRREGHGRRAHRRTRRGGASPAGPRGLPRSPGGAAAHGRVPAGGDRPRARGALRGDRGGPVPRRPAAAGAPGPRDRAAADADPGCRPARGGGPRGRRSPGRDRHRQGPRRRRGARGHDRGGPPRRRPRLGRRAGPGHRPRRPRRRRRTPPGRSRRCCEPSR